MGIDRTSKRPVFKQIYEILITEMDDGLYNGTGKLPSEKELCQRFGVERNTLRKALQILVDQRRIARTRGSGTKVLPPPSGEKPAAHGPRAGKSVMLIANEDYLRSGDGESFHYKLIHSLEKRIWEIGYNLLFKSVGNHGTAMASIQNAAPAAIIFDSYNDSSYYLEALRFGVPCISINHYTPLMTSIVSNNADSAYQVAQRLTDAGHSKIALILGKRAHQTCMERLNGVQSLFMARNLPLKAEYLFPGNWLFGSGAEAGDRIAAMAEADRPTAVFAFNDDMAYGCYSSLVRHGLSVPGDISLVGFDRSEHYSGIFPALTTVDVNLSAIVDYACWVLWDNLCGQMPKTRAKIQIDAELFDSGTIRSINNG